MKVILLRGSSKDLFLHPNTQPDLLLKQETLLGHLVKVSLIITLHSSVLSTPSESQLIFFFLSRPLFLSLALLFLFLFFFPFVCLPTVTSCPSTGHSSHPHCLSLASFFLFSLSLPVLLVKFALFTSINSSIGHCLWWYPVITPERVGLKTRSSLPLTARLAFLSPCLSLSRSFSLAHSLFRSALCVCD